MHAARIVNTDVETCAYVLRGKTFHDFTNRVRHGQELVIITGQPVSQKLANVLVTEFGAVVLGAEPTDFHHPGR